MASRGRYGRPKYRSAAASPVGWIPSPSLRESYEAIFSVALDGSGVTVNELSGKTAVDFFRKSGLESATLKEVWAIADFTDKGRLGIEEFCVACRLIAMAQAGKPVTRGALAQFSWIPLDPPRFEGVYVGGASTASSSGGASSGETAARAAQQAEIHRRRSSPWNVDRATRDKYVGLFKGLQLDGEGELPGGTAVAFLSKSGLNRQTLKRIWDLCDVDGNGKLNENEFVCAFHMSVCVSKRGLSLPNTLPSEMLPASSANALPLSTGPSAQQQADAMLAAMDAEKEAKRKAIADKEAAKRRAVEEKKRKAADARMKKDLTSFVREYESKRMERHKLTALWAEAEALKGDMQDQVDALRSWTDIHRSQAERLEREKAYLLRSRERMHLDRKALEKEHEDSRAELINADAELRGLVFELEELGIAYEMKKSDAIATLGTDPETAKRIAALDGYDLDLQGMQVKVDAWAGEPPCAENKVALALMVGAIDKILMKGIDTVSSGGLPPASAQEVKSRRKELAKTAQTLQGRVKDLHDAISQSI